MTSSPVALAVVRAVPYFQPAGSRTEGTHSTASEATPSGYRTTWFQLRSRRLVEAAGPPPPALSAEMRSKVA